MGHRMDSREEISIDMELICLQKCSKDFDFGTFFGTLDKNLWLIIPIFTESAPLGRLKHRVAMSVHLSVCMFVCVFVCAIKCSFFKASYWP